MKSLATVVAVLLAAGVAQAERTERSDRAERSDVALLADAAAHAHAGRHARAIAIYEQVFSRSGDHELLPVLGVQYRAAGAQRKAVQHFCSYLRFVPRGAQVWFATNQVIALRRDLGDVIDARNVCAPTRVDFAPRPSRKSVSTRQRAAVASATRPR